MLKNLKKPMFMVVATRRLLCIIIHLHVHQLNVLESWIVMEQEVVHLHIDVIDVDIHLLVAIVGVMMQMIIYIHVQQDTNVHKQSIPVVIQGQVIAYKATGCGKSNA